MYLQHLTTYFKNINKYEVLAKEVSVSNSNPGEIPPIDTQTRIEIVRIIADFVLENFSAKPSGCQKLSTTRAAVALFPRLKFSNSTGDGTVIICSNLQ